MYVSVKWTWSNVLVCTRIYSKLTLINLNSKYSCTNNYAEQRNVRSDSKNLEPRGLATASALRVKYEQRARKTRSKWKTKSSGQNGKQKAAVKMENGKQKAVVKKKTFKRIALSTISFCTYDKHDSNLTPIWKSKLDSE